MTGFGAALWAETLKARRSRAAWFTGGAISLLPLVGALFMAILRDPDWAKRTGLLNAKANALAGTADWASYWAFIEQGLAMGGFFVFGLAITWVFGREFSDRAATDLLALPTARDAIVLAKLLVVAVWSALLTMLVVALSAILGTLLDLPGGAAMSPAEAVRTTVAVASSTLVGLPPLAWVASAGRGYLPAVGAMLLLVVVAQVLTTLGWGSVFPWAVPALLARTAGPDVPPPGVASLALVLAAGGLGLAATLAHWRFADQS